MQNASLMKGLVVGIILLLLGSNISFVSSEVLKNKNYSFNLLSYYHKYTKEIYNIETKDGFSVILTRYVGSKRLSIMLIHGMSCNHKIFDWDENHSLARFLNNDDWDVWMLDLRTHDGDGDFWFGELRGMESDREPICRYWDFDRTYLQKDVETAVAFVLNMSQYKQIILGGHSYGGYLAYAYAESIGQKNLAGILTTDASALANPFSYSFLERCKYGIRIGKKAFVRPCGIPFSHMPKFRLDRLAGNPIPGLFNTTPLFIQKQAVYSLDDEPAGVWVDMFFGKDPRYHSGHWVDPQTLYDYTANLKAISVPALFIAGGEDNQDPSNDIFSTFENVSSEPKLFLNFPGYAHIDLLLGENASVDVFPHITSWLNLLSI
jgi:pimeloyl-ACP methyl ester carboxylesterase